MASHPAIIQPLIRYKFLNSLFLGLSVGAVFVQIRRSRRLCSPRAGWVVSGTLISHSIGAILSPLVFSPGFSSN